MKELKKDDIQVQEDNKIVYMDKKIYVPNKQRI